MNQHLIHRTSARTCSLRRRAASALTTSAAVLCALPAIAADVTSTWNAASGNWGTASNWTNLPVAGGFPNNGNGGVATYDAVLSNGGTITLDQNIVIERFTLSSGTVTGSFDLTLNGNLTASGGRMSGIGTTSVAGASSTISGSFGLDTGRVLRIDNTLTWSAGQIDLNASTGAGSGTMRTAVGGTFVAAGNSVDSLFANNQGGTDTGSSALFENLGTFRKSGSAASDLTTVSVAFNNAGSVEVQSGILSLSNGGTQSGTFDMATDAELRFGGGIHTLNGGSSSGVGTLAVTSGTVTSNSAFTVGSGFRQSGGLLSGAGSFTISGVAALSGGVQSGAGSTVLQSASTITGSFGLDAGRLLRIENTLTWSAGQIDLNASTGAGSGTMRTAVGGTFVAAGNSVDSLFANNQGGVDTGSSALFENLGIFRKSGSAVNDLTTVSVAFNNVGSVEVQSGILSLSNGGTHSGSFDIAAGAELRFAGGTHTVTSPGSSGAGTLAVTNGTVNWNGVFGVAGLTQLSGGILSIADTGSTGTLTQSGGTLSGAGTLTVGGAAALSGGDQSGVGTTILQGASTITGSFGLDGGRLLRIDNTLTWSGGNINLNSNSVAGSGTLRTALGGTFVASGDNTASIFASNFGGADTGASALFENLGTFRKSGSAVNDLTTVSVAFNNAGSVEVQSGILSLNNGGTHSGNFDIAAGAELRFAGGTHTVTSAGPSGAGTLAVTTGTVNWNGVFGVAGLTQLSSGILSIADTGSTGTLTQSGGTLSGAGALTVGGAAALSGGDQSGVGTTILQGASTITGSFGLDAGRLLRIDNTLTWSGGNINLNSNSVAGSGTLRTALGGTFAASGDNTASISASNFGGADTGASALFENLGTFRKSGSAVGNLTTVSVVFNNAGSVEVQSGILSLSGGGTHSGTFNIAQDTELQLSGGTHTISGGSSSGAGTLAVTSGTVTSNSAFTVGSGFRQSGGTLRCRNAHGRRRGGAERRRSERCRHDHLAGGEHDHGFFWARWGALAAD